jgi:hypothetical protein
MCFAVQNRTNDIAWIASKINYCASHGAFIFGDSVMQLHNERTMSLSLYNFLWIDLVS